jgi:hypothetical protein
LDDIEQPSEGLEISEIIPEEPKKEPSRFNLFLRRLLRWATAVLAIFVLGIVLTWIVQVRPSVKEVRELGEQVEQLEGELDDLNEAEAENVILRANLEDTQLHLSLLSILVDVSSAQLALNDDNLETAQASLAETDVKLDFLLENLGTDQQETLEAMQERLSLALGEINEDAFAAQSDLEVLRNSILALERSLFGN